MTHSESINELAAALAKAQGAIEGAVKGKENPHFRSKYADLGAVWDACREHLTKNGIAVVQPVGQTTAGTLCTFTLLVHGSGQWMQDDGIPLLLSKQDMQGLGSALTYSRRYGLMSMVGIAPEDDDGNAASAKSGQAEQKTLVIAPAGFDKWLDGLRDVAPEGIDALKKAWTSANPLFRQHLTKTNPDLWEGLKAKAAQAETVPA
jgi:hypothetical protein